MKSADGVHLQEKGLKNTRFQVLFYEKMPSQYHKKAGKRSSFPAFLSRKEENPGKQMGKMGPHTNDFPKNVCRG